MVKNKAFCISSSPRLDTEFAALRHRQYLNELEGQIEDMLCDITMDHKKIVRELNYKCGYSTQAIVDVVKP